jgi:two-component system LytT family sensor kinase
MKHPVLKNRVRHIVWWLVWLFLGLGQSLIYFFAYGNLPQNYGSFLQISIPDSLISICVYSGISLMLWYPFRYFNHSVAKTAVLISNLIVSGGITVSLWAIATKLLAMLLLPGGTMYQAYWDATFPYRIGTGVFIYGLVILTYYLFISLNNLAEKNVREVKLESLVKETELKVLRSQINPHFLFNSLNSISSLTITDPEKARIMVIKLSEFMRYALSRKDDRPVTLQSELDNLRLYLEIEKVRFGDKLMTEELICEECRSALMPVMLLQPLYENAVKHGVYESTEKVNISTAASIKNGYLEVTITNNFDPSAVPVTGTGTGLSNVSRRLELFYGSKGVLRTNKENGIFTINLFIPYITGS